MSESDINMHPALFVGSSICVFIIGLGLGLTEGRKAVITAKTDERAGCTLQLDKQRETYERSLTEIAESHRTTAKSLNAQCVKDIDDIADRCVQNLRRLEGRINQR